MNESNRDVKEEASDVVFYGDPGIASADAPPPKWLIFSNWFFVFLGLLWFYLFWNGSIGWFDRGYWNQLQRAANTAYPYTTMQIVEMETKEKQAELPSVPNPENLIPE